MARARNIKPGFFSNDQLAECEPLARLLFAGLWTVADREGRLEDRPKRIKAEILPFDTCNVDDLLTSLHEAGFIIRYSIDINDYIQIVNFIKHQNPHTKEAASTIPAMPGHIDSGCTPYYVPPVQRQRIFSRDNFKCKRCGNTHRLSIDHIIPRSKGGSNDDDNLQTLCIYCNSSKGNDLPVTSHVITRQESDEQLTSREKDMTSPADSPILIPDSLILNPSPESIACAREDDRSVDNSNLGEGVSTHPNPDHPDFNVFWEKYPKRKDMPEAVKAWEILVAQGVRPSYIIHAAMRYASREREKGTETKFLKAPQNFLTFSVLREYLPRNIPDCPRCRGQGGILDIDDDGRSTTQPCDCWSAIIDAGRKAG